MKLFRIPLILFGSLVFSWSLRAQVTTGFPPMGSFSSNTFDSIDNANLNVHFSVPIVSKAGRGMPFAYALSYDNSFWQNNGSFWYARTTSSTNLFGWQGVTDASTGVLSYSDTPTSCEDNIGDTFFFDIYSSWVFYDQQGTPHSFGSVTISTYNITWKCGTGYPPKTASGSATDNSGYSLSATIDSRGNPSGSIHDQSGNAIVARLDPATSTPISAYTVTDPNQNKISVTTDGLTFTDTIGSAVLTTSGSGTPTSPRIFTYKGPGGASEQVKVYYVQKTVQTAFGCTGISESSATSVNLVSEIDLADIGINPNDKYSFTYETTPGHSPNVTGRIASVTLPTGGTITYNYSGGNNGINCTDGTTPTLTRITPDGTWTYAHTENGNAWTTTITDPGSNQTVMNFQGIMETERKVYQGSSTLLATIDTCYNGAAIPCTNTAITTPINNRTVQMTLPSLSPSKTYTAYNSNSLPTEIDEYTYGGTSPVRSTIYTYATLTNTWIKDRPSTIQVKSGATVVAQTAFTNYDSAGNVGTITYSGQGMSALAKSFTYGANGVLSTITDFNSAQTTVTYQTCNGGNAYPSTISLPQSLSATENWNCDGGVLNSTTDANSKITNFQYDALWRPTTTSFPDGGSVTNSYSPNQISSVISITGSTSRTDTTSLDTLGRISSQTVRGVTTNTSYDSLGRVHTVSISGSGAQDTYQYDGLGRMTLLTRADGNTIGTDWTTNPQCPKTTDEAQNVKTVCSDALGRVTSVVDGLGNTTSYTYDVLNDLTGVTQGAQTRTYAYDGLGRLLSAKTPEAGQTTYTYTSGGDLATRVDARGITTCYGNWTGTSCDTSGGYDALNRLLEKSYSDGTPAANFFYDGGSGGFGSWVVNGLTNTKGRFYAACTSAAPTRVCPGGYTGVMYDFDAVGRVKDSWQCTPYNCGSSAWQMTYAYDLAGDVTSYSHPAGFTITNAVDSNQRITQVTSTLNDSTHPGTLATMTYNSWGALATLLNGCAGTGCVQRQETYDYNDRLQPVRIQLGTTSSPSANYCLVYNYYTSVANPGSCGIPSQGTGNNGNVMGYLYQDNSNTGLSHTASYTYDAVNRLATASAARFGSGTVSYSKSFNYDQYGNMSWLPGSGTVLTYIASSNHINQVGSLFAGYDPAGNMTSDGTNTYQYDAENRLVQVTQGSTILSTNTYNALGLQVRRVGPNGFTVDLPYDADGRTTGFFNGAAGTWWEQQFWGGGRLLGHYNNGTTYLIHRSEVGSPSPTQITDATGAQGGDAIFYPWGELWQYDNEVNVWWQFFGSISRFQADLDQYLTPNRLYRPGLGRWLTPDPLGGDVTNPQSLNRYTYVTNNPTTLTDPLGLNPADNCSDASYYYSHARCGGPPPGSGCGQYDNGSCEGDPTCDNSFGLNGPINCGGSPAEVLGFPIGGNGSGAGGPAPAPPSAPPAGQPPLRGGMGFEPGAGTIEQTAPFWIQIIVQACASNPICMLAAGLDPEVVAGVAGIGLAAWEIYKLVPSIHYAHQKGARPSTTGKHQAGTSRQAKDRGGEKGDARRRPPRKRPKGWKGPWPPDIVPES